MQPAHTVHEKGSGLLTDVQRNYDSTPTKDLEKRFQILSLKLIPFRNAHERVGCNQYTNL